MPETSFIPLIATQTAAGSVVDMVLLDAIRADLKYLKEHFVRGGSVSSGKQMIIARGKELFSDTTNGSGYVDISVSVTFSSAGTDGDPTFDPVNILESVVTTLEEYTGGSGAAWPAVGTDPNQNMGVFFDSTGPSDTGFTATVQLHDWPPNTTYEGYLHWMAFMRE